MYELKPPPAVHMSHHPTPNETELHSFPADSRPYYPNDNDDDVYPRPMPRDPPPPYSTDAHQQAADEDAQRIPYPRWLTLLVRGSVMIVELVALGYTAAFLTKWSSAKDPDLNAATEYLMGVIVCVIAAVLEMIVCTLTLARRYSKFWATASVLDMCVAALAMVAMLKISARTNRVSSWAWNFAYESSRLGMFQLVISIIHMIAMAGGWMGCCLVRRGQRQDPESG
ncbi:hypothetical protein QBC47DRAFT_464132 [Echria macrotheca]|uniref:MARVEL domain-containing protein n=1 Tax=Echria macrotheca TaxID=438768 RepID=A0AAJ0B494_9PEZI|nr:hypothetical protein QBC47DRAFT_464132 [Echria macrotheca]